MRDVAAHFCRRQPITKRLADVRARIFRRHEFVDPGTGSGARGQHPADAAGRRPRRDTGRKQITTRTIRRNFSSTPAKEQEAPLTYCCAVEKGGSGDDACRVNSSRMVVVSNATFIQDNALTQDQQGLDFISGSVNWLLSREQMIGIAPKVSQDAHLQPG